MRLTYRAGVITAAVRVSYIRLRIVLGIYSNPNYFAEDYVEPGYVVVFTSTPTFPP
jgi:hypothetical protein